MQKEIIPWQIEGEKVAVIDLIFLGSKITMDSDCSHEIKRYLLLGESYDKPRASSLSPYYFST